MEGDENIDEKEIERLPRHKPDDEVWERIDTELWFNEKVSPLAEGLQMYRAPDHVWQGIETKLHRYDSDKNTWRLVKLVASVSLIVAATLGIRKLVMVNEPEVTVYEESTNGQEYASSFFGANGEDPIREIEAVCRLRMDICATNEMKELLKQLDQLNDEIRTLNALYPEHVNGQDFPELEKLKLKVDNSRDEIVKAIMVIIEA